MKERNYIIKITKFDMLHFKPLIMSDKSLGSSGTESRVLLCRNVLDLLDTRDSQWQKLTYLASSKTR